MTSKLITAYTLDGRNPQYLNISFLDENTVRLTIRDKEQYEDEGYYTVGETVCMDIPRDIAIDLFIEAVDKVSYE